jgi:hypothetical protein
MGGMYAGKLWKPDRGDIKDEEMACSLMHTNTAGKSSGGRRQSLEKSRDHEQNQAHFHKEALWNLQP